MTYYALSPSLEACLQAYVEENRSAIFEGMPADDRQKMARVEELWRKFAKEHIMGQKDAAPDNTVPASK